MPIGFLPSGEAATAITLSNQEQRVVNYLATLMREGHDKEVQDYDIRKQYPWDYGEAHGKITEPLSRLRVTAAAV